MRLNFFSKPRLMVFVVLVGIVLIVLGIGVWLYSFVGVLDRQQALTVLSEGSGDYYRVEGALDWWKSAYKTIFLPFSSILIGVGTLVLTYILLRTQFFQQKDGVE